MSLWSAVHSIEASYPPPTWEAAAYLGSHMPLPGDTAHVLKMGEECPRQVLLLPTQQYKPPQTRRPDVVLLDLKEDGSFPSQACDN